MAQVSTDHIQCYFWFWRVAKMLQNKTNQQTTLKNPTGSSLRLNLNAHTLSAITSLKHTCIQCTIFCHHTCFSSSTLSFVETHLLKFCQNQSDHTIHEIMMFPWQNITRLVGSSPAPELLTISQNMFQSQQMVFFFMSGEIPGEECFFFKVQFMCVFCIHYGKLEWETAIESCGYLNWTVSTNPWSFAVYRGSLPCSKGMDHKPSKGARNLNLC